mmetsp:Transcript_5565/g.23128  ORF Transcript_5565/g.23128 Transcript_5565/m.23128 type:complete len:177 (-) Transcript_5565:834-1364(-)
MMDGGALARASFDRRGEPTEARRAWARGGRKGDVKIQEHQRTSGRATATMDRRPHKAERQGSRDPCTRREDNREQRPYASIPAQERFRGDDEGTNERTKVSADARKKRASDEEKGALLEGETTHRGQRPPPVLFLSFEARPARRSSSPAEWVRRPFSRAAPDDRDATRLQAPCAGP